jgi:hypothetical protein
MKLKALLLIGLLAACGTSSPDGIDESDHDPRCVAACPATMPRYEGVGEVCDAASREQCLDQCAARIAGVSPVCQSCLVEDACFGPDGCVGDEGIFGMCTNTTNTCTVSSEFGMCTYSINDEAAKLKCYQQVNPRREVTCEARFRPTTECATVCQ